MDSPEKVLHQAHGQARPIAEFLHENGNCIITLPLWTTFLVIYIYTVWAINS